MILRKLLLLASLLLGTSVVLASSNAMASQDQTKTTETKGGYGYEFSDDPLDAGGFGANDVTIRVRPAAARSTLIRPRTSFVPELLMSVENV